MQTSNPLLTTWVVHGELLMTGDLDIRKTGDQEMVGALGRLRDPAKAGHLSIMISGMKDPDIRQVVMTGDRVITFLVHTIEMNCIHL